MTISMTSLGLILVTVGLAQKFGCLATGIGLVVVSAAIAALNTFIAARQIAELKRRMTQTYHTH